MTRLVWNAIVVGIALLGILLAFVALRIEQQSTRDEARPSDVILVVGAAEYRGRPSPVLRSRLDHAYDLYTRKLAPLIMTTGGGGGGPALSERGGGRGVPNAAGGGVRAE